jgi:hypothetical protein
MLPPHHAVSRLQETQVGCCCCSLSCCLLSVSTVASHFYTALDLLLMDASKS